jgi:hypothetical protein
MPEARQVAFKPIRVRQAPPPGAPPFDRLADVVRQHWAVIAAAAVVLLILVVAVSLTVDSDDRPSPSATAARATATVPTPAATLAPVTGSATRVPGVYAFVNTPTPAPSVGRTPLGSPTAAPSSTATPRQSAEPGVGSTRGTLEAQYGLPQVTRPDGVSVYMVEQTAVSVLYSDDGLALRIVLDFTLSDPPLTRADAADLLANYRPADADPLRTATPAAGVERRTYASAALADRFAGRDTAGRTASRYVEEIRWDPVSGFVITVTMAVGNEG